MLKFYHEVIRSGLFFSPRTNRKNMYFTWDDFNVHTAITTIQVCWPDCSIPECWNPGLPSTDSNVGFLFQLLGES